MPVDSAVIPTGTELLISFHVLEPFAPDHFMNTIRLMTVKGSVLLRFEPSSLAEVSQFRE